VWEIEWVSVLIRKLAKRVITYLTTGSLFRDVPSLREIPEVFTMAHTVMSQISNVLSRRHVIRVRQYVQGQNGLSIYCNLSVQYIRLLLSKSFNKVKICTEHKQYLTKGWDQTSMVLQL
jgi:hypothetical protein